MKYIYIKINIGYVEFDSPISPELNGNNLGTTYQDYLDGKWVQLNNEQITFHNEHPNALIEEVFTLTTPSVNLEQLKRQKINEIYAYDSSNAVNGFIINFGGNEMQGWFTASERSNYKASIEASKISCLENISFFIGDTFLTIPIILAEQLLTQIQLYADQCFIVTKQHIIAVEAMTTEQEINNFDITAGYPTKLQFTI